MRQANTSTLCLLSIINFGDKLVTRMGRVQQPCKQRVQFCIIGINFVERRIAAIERLPLRPVTRYQPSDFHSLFLHSLPVIRSGSHITAPYRDFKHTVC